MLEVRAACLPAAAGLQHLSRARVFPAFVMPVLPFVAIEIPAEVAPDLMATTLRTCNLALGNGRCSIASRGAADSGARWLAHVAVDAGRPQRFHIDLRDALFENPATTFSRALEFEASDAPAHRWSTVGVVVAALVVNAESGSFSDVDAAPLSGVVSPEIERAPDPATPANPSEGSTSVEPTAPGDSPPAAPVLTPRPNQSDKTAESSPFDEASTARSSRRAFDEGPALRLDAAALLGTGAVSNATRYGVALRPAFEFAQGQILWGQFGWSWDSGEIDVAWVASALGLGAKTVILPGWLSAEARAGAWLNHLRFEATDPVRGHDRAILWRYGVGAGLDAWLSLSNHLGWFVGIDIQVANPRVVVRLMGREVGQSPTIDAIVATGVRCRFPLL